MNKKFTKLLAALALLVFMTPSLAGWGQTKITDYSNIVSGNTYYIGATTGGTDYYLYVYHDNNSSSTAGTAKTSMNDATTFVLEGSGTSWTLKFDNGKYLSLKNEKDNGKVQVVTDPATFTTSNQSGKIRLSKGSYSVQKNNSGTQFGSYANTQTDIWLMEVPSSLTLTTVTIDASGITNTDVYTSTSAGSLSATVTENTNNTIISGATVTWSSSNESVATIANDGTVTLVAEGTTTITAYYAGVNGEYGESSATYELNVSDSTPFAGGDVTFVAGTDLGSTTTTGEDQMTKKVVTVYSTSAAFATAEYRLYSGSTTTISTSFGTITRIEFTKNGNYSLGNLSTETGTYTSSTGVWTGDASSVDFYASAQVRLDQIAVTVTAPSSGVATTTTINVPGDFNNNIFTSTVAGTLSATVTESTNNTVISGATVSWESSNTNVATIASDGTVTLVTAGTTIITASYAGVQDQYRPSSATYELIVINQDPNAPGTQNNPYTVAQARTAIDDNTGITGVYVTGIVSNIQTAYSNNRITFDIVDETGDEAFLRAYRCTGTEAANVLVGDVVVVFGNLTLYTNNSGSIYELSEGCQLISLQHPAQHTLTITMNHVADFTVFAGDETLSETGTVQVYAGTTIGVSIGGMENCYLFGSLTVNGSTTGVTQDDPDDLYFEFTMPDGDAEIDVTTTAATPFTLTVIGMDDVSFDMYMGYNSTEVTIIEGVASICEQTHVTIADLIANTGLIVQSVTVTDGAGQSVTVSQEGSAYVFTMPSSNATLTFTTAEVTTYTYTRASSIVSGNTYIIVGQNNGVYYAMGSQRDNNRDAAVITVNGTTATVSSEDVYEFTISSLAEAGFYSIYDARTPGYLYAAAPSSNHLKTETTLDSNHNGDWEITFDAESGTASIVASQSSNRNYMRFNQQSHIFSCYASNNYTAQHPVYLYERVYTKEIEAEQWYLISSPVGSVNPTAVGNLTTGTYGLYSFDQTGGDDGKEWRNYKAGAFNQLQAGTGYLYINQDGCTLTFTGTAYNGEGTFPLDYSTTNATTTFHGLNLLGNPYAQSAAIDHDYYIMNANGTDLTVYQSGDIVPAMQGVFVKVTEEGQSVTFTPSQSTTGGKGIEINLTQNRGAIVDRAIVRFGEGRQLSKVQLFDNSTKLYIPQNGKDYAIVSTEAQGELPVNFSASENGTYTLGMDVKNMDVNYLHLIDNMTGMDVDLLQTPSYTFEATTTDYESRFRLVFAGNNANTDSDNFAFFSNGNLIINNEGNATLQVIDLNGRILSSESVNGSVSTTLNATPGVYMLRLINGENVKVQKIVVR